MPRFGTEKDILTATFARKPRSCNRGSAVRKKEQCFRYKNVTIYSLFFVVFTGKFTQSWAEAGGSRGESKAFVHSTERTCKENCFERRKMAERQSMDFRVEAMVCNVFKKQEKGSHVFIKVTFNCKKWALEGVKEDSEEHVKPGVQFLTQRYTRSLIDKLASNWKRHSVLSYWLMSCRPQHVHSL